MMRKEESLPYRIESLTALHRVFGLPKPVHPLVSFTALQDINMQRESLPDTLLLNFYKVVFKTAVAGKVRYGQHYYDFGEGGLAFAAPNQIFETPPAHGESTGFVLFVHPDFLLSYPLAKTIRKYGFFAYDANEALHLSEGEKETILAIFKIMENELKSRIDDFSQDVMISQIELLLNYSNRFYKRQFITRKAVNHDLLQKLEDVLDAYFSSERPGAQGIPTVQFLAERLALSPSYLSDLLRSLTGRNAQQHIHDKLIEKAKEKLSTTRLSVSEIAYELGFEHPQSFSRLFKTKTHLSPQAFKQLFNG